MVEIPRKFVGFGMVLRQKGSASGSLTIQERNVTEFMSAHTARTRGSSLSPTSVSSAPRDSLLAQIEMMVGGVLSITTLTDHRIRAGDQKLNWYLLAMATKTQSRHPLLHQPQVPVYMMLIPEGLKNTHGTVMMR